MDFIKKHYEKIVLAVALVALIGSAAFLAFKVSALSEEVTDAIRSRPKGKPLEPVDIGIYTNAIACLQAPPMWNDGPDMFQTGERVLATKDPVGGAPVQPTHDPYTLREISRRPFKLIFKSYTGDGQNFAINFLTRARTFFVAEVGMEIADKFEQTGYFIKKFEQKNVVQEVPGVGKRELDASELTIQYAADEPIKLVLNRETQEKEPVASIQCTEGGQLRLASRQQEFTCGDKIYIVVDITSTQLIIMDKLSKEKHTVSVPGIGK